MFKVTTFNDFYLTLTRLECTQSGARRLVVFTRAKTIIMGGERKKKGAPVFWLSVIICK